MAVCDNFSGRGLNNLSGRSAADRSGSPPGGAGAEGVRGGSNGKWREAAGRESGNWELLWEDTESYRFFESIGPLTAFAVFPRESLLNYRFPHLSPGLFRQLVAYVP